MNAISPAAPLEPRWKTYFLATSLLLPALAVWQLTRVYLFPKLQLIWSRSGVNPGDAGAQQVMDVVNFLVQRGGLLLAVVVGTVLLLEWRARGFASHRWPALALALFTIHFTVMVGLMCMCIAALLAAPAK